MLQPGLGTEAQPATPWGELITPAPCSVLGLAEQAGFSSANRRDNIALAHLSRKQSLSTCRLNPRDPPLTHSFQGTSQDLRTKHKYSFSSPFLTAAFPLPAQSHPWSLSQRLEQITCYGRLQPLVCTRRIPLGDQGEGPCFPETDVRHSVMRRSWTEAESWPSTPLQNHSTS